MAPLQKEKQMEKNVKPDQSPTIYIDSSKKNGIQKALILGNKTQGVEIYQHSSEDWLKMLENGNVLVVYTGNLLSIAVWDLVARFYFLKSASKNTYRRLIHDVIDTNTVFGKLIFHSLLTLIKFRKDLRIYLTKIGLANCREGRRLKEAPIPYTLHNKTLISIDDICTALKVPRSKVYSNIKKIENKLPPKS